MTAREMLKAAYGTSKNFMTPHVVKVGKAQGKFAWELSSGEGFEHEPIYGVSVVEDKGSEIVKRTDLGMMFYSVQEAENYIQLLKIKPI